MFAKQVLIMLLFIILSPPTLEMQKSETKPAVKKSEVTKLKRKSEYQSWGCRGVDEEQPDHLSAIPPLVIAPGRLLVTVCNTVYMLDSHQNVLWSWSTSAASLTDQPVIDSTGTIYIIAYDLIWVALDANTGAKKWERDSNGRAVYSQIKAYKDDTYLVVVDMSGYRDNLVDKSINDGLLLCKGEDIMWRKDFPPGSVLQVWGEKILAINYKKDEAEIVEIPQ